MQSKASRISGYLAELPEDRRQLVDRLRKIIKKNLPKGFQEVMSYGMIGYVIPHKIYPAGYHCDPSLPLPFINLASQKNFVALYHMGLYSDKKLLDWFTGEWEKATTSRLDMGKSCIRFKKPESIPYDLIGQLASKMTPEDWIKKYEAAKRNN
ncbi:MAG TPA: DUF1801 domain-containing protein [Saprospiraceae bacterium]|nr:DUF1801 domain-containing protein [Saprospiraceae bacterium]HNT22514.1 DUF1801 domain-containing protein [Saprospiraceae bacterium]